MVLSRDLIASGTFLKRRKGAASPDPQWVLVRCHFSKSISPSSFRCSFSVGPFQGSSVCLVLGQSVSCLGSSAGVSRGSSSCADLFPLLMAQLLMSEIIRVFHALGPSCIHTHELPEKPARPDACRLAISRLFFRR